MLAALVAQVCGGAQGSAATAGRETTSASGEQLWVARYNGPANGPETIWPGVVQSVALSPDGTKVFVTGGSAGASAGNDYATVAYRAATGKQLWVARYDGPANGDDIATIVAVSPDGTKVFVTGGSTGTNSSFDVATVAYDAATGAQRWVARYDGPAGKNEGGGSLAVDPSGAKVFVTGTSEGAASAEKTYATLAYDAATGTQVWVERFDGPANRDSAASVAVSPSGSAVYVTGWSQLKPHEEKDFATVAYDASTGAQTWVARYHTPQGFDDEGRSVVVSPDGARVFVTGYSSAPSGPGYTTVAYKASTGTQQWAQRVESPPRTGDTYASPMAVSPDGATVLVTGVHATVAYKAGTGTRLWVRPDAASVAVSRNGATVFVTGTRKGATTGRNYATVAYNAATGKRLWAARYNGPADRGDRASSVAVSPKGGRVFVTGISEGVGSGPDFATVAYRD